MNKRGPIIGIAGTGLIAISFAVALFSIPQSNPTMRDQMTISTMLEGMFDQVSDETVIFQDQSSSFSFTTKSSNVPLMWGIQIIDYQSGDSATVSISSMFGEYIGQFKVDGPIFFDTFLIPSSDTYNFKITNTGNRPLSVITMFSENPDNTNIFSNTNSPAAKLVVPILISGISLILGLVITGVGIVLMIIDWRKNKNESRYT